MRQIILLGISSLFLLNACTTENQEPPQLLTQTELEQVAQLRDSALKSNLGYELIESLTTEVGARMAGTPQDTLAVEWAVKKFQELGFDRVRKEPVVFKTWVRGVETAEVTAPFPQSLHITALGGSIATVEGGVTAQVIHFKTLEELKAADPADVKGKIVFISNKMERSKTGSGYGRAVVVRRNGAIESALKGAAAVLIRSIGTDSNRMPHTGMMAYKEEVTKIPAAALSNPDADQLERILKRTDDVSIKLNIGAYAGSLFTSYNVIGELTGTESPDEFIIMGGHLDSWDMGTGALDDGAGVGITMAAAKLIKESGIKHRRSIRVILWAAEEQGLLGAFAYANAHKKDLKRHIVGAESDFGAGKVYEFSSLVTDEDLPFIDQMETMFKPLGIARGNNDARPGPDLIPLYRIGMPVFRLQQDGTDYFDLHHTHDDTLDKIDPSAISQNVAAYVVYALMTAQYQGSLKRPPMETK